MLATREDIEATLSDLPPLYNPPHLPKCYTRNLKVPRNRAEEKRSEYPHLRKDSSGRQLHGLPETGAFEPVWQGVDKYINAILVFYWKADEYVWPSKPQAGDVARGDEQRANVDSTELFPPDVAVSSVRLLTAMACKLDLDLRHFEIEQAFVQSELDENVFMRLPQGCVRSSGKMGRLNKSIYILKQASRQWHAHLTRCLLTLGFLQCLAHACVFRLMEDERVVTTIVVNVNDVFAVGEKTRCDQFGTDFNQMVPVKSL